MRVLHVSPYAGEAWAYGGIPRVVEALTDGLASRGHDVTVCTTDVIDQRRRLSGPRRRMQPWSFTRPSGVTVRVFPNVSNRLAYHAQLFAPIGLRTFLQRRMQDYHLAHIHACRNALGLLAAAACRRARVPYVVAPHGTAPVIERRLFAKRVVDRLWGRRMLEDAACVLAVSDAERADLRQFGVPTHAIRRVSNPVAGTDPPRTRAQGTFRRQLGLADGPLVLFLGKLTPRKRVDVAIRAFAHLRDPRTHLVIAGNDMGARSSLEALVAELGVRSRVTFSGLLEGDSRIDALADADLVVYPSAHEVFGLVPCEALMAGTPVVVSRDSGCGEILGAYPGVSTVEVGDVEGLAASMRDVLRERRGSRAAAREGGQLVRARFTVRRACDELEQIYDDVL